LGIETVEDLLTHFPRRHEDRTEFPRFPREESDVPICLCGEVVKTSLRRFGGWKKIFEATLQESNPNALSEPLVCRWFNLHYVQKMIASGQQVVVFGKPRLRGNRICMEHPEFEVIENDEEISIHFRRITPIYPATEGLSQRVLRSTIYRLLNELPSGPAGLETLAQAILFVARDATRFARSISRTVGTRVTLRVNIWCSLSSSRCKCSLHRDASMLRFGAARSTVATARCATAF